MLIALLTCFGLYLAIGMLTMGVIHWILRIVTLQEFVMGTLGWPFVVWEFARGFFSLIWNHWTR